MGVVKVVVVPVVEREKRWLNERVECHVSDICYGTPEVRLCDGYGGLYR